MLLPVVAKFANVIAGLFRHCFLILYNFAGKPRVFQEQSFFWVELVLDDTGYLSDAGLSLT